MITSMKSVLITGCAGFLGSHLAAHHLNSGDKVFGFDNFSSSRPTSKHLAALMAHQSFKFQNLDITDTSQFDSMCDMFNDNELNQKFDLIYNFACPASPPRYQSIPIETMLTCTLGVKNVLNLARVCGARVVHASTSEVYGNPQVSPQSEAYLGNVNSYGPRACYDAGKQAAEALCYDYLNKYNVDVRLVRIFNTYGPNMDPDDGRVISNLISQALKGLPMTIYGDGSQTRSFCYVDDLIRGIVSLSELKQNPGSPINIGNPDEFTMLELAKIVAEKTYGGDPIVVFKKLPKDDPEQRLPDISLAENLLGFEPTIMLDEGLERTIEYFKWVTL
jgi:UDP-glucuronate decarboxylase